MASYVLIWFKAFCGNKCWIIVHYISTCMNECSPNDLDGHLNPNNFTAELFTSLSYYNYSYMHILLL